MSVTRRVGRLLASAALAALAAACQTTREEEAAVKPEVALSYLAGKPAELQRHFYVTATQGKRNQVLNDMRLGLASIELGDTPLAEELFDDALTNIEAIYVNNEAAAKARDLFTKELTKDFKGEPYERAMAYYYRGLLYMRAGDYDNARASFKAGFIQDSFADEDQNQADFGLLQFLQGWASRCRGNAATAAEDFREFKAINDSFPLPADKDNTLLLVETGSAPVKFSATAANDTKPKFLKYRRTSATESARVSVALPVEPPPAPAPTLQKGKKAAAPPPSPAPAPAPSAPRQIALPMLEDIYFQASTRGGREFDAVLAGKAQFKDVSNTVSKAAMVGALAAANYAGVSNNRQHQRDAAAAAGAMLLIGVLAKAASDASEPDADTRYWDNLPDRVHAVTLALPPQMTNLPVDFVSADGVVLRSRDAKIIRSGSCGLAWVRGDSAIPFNPRAPYSAPPKTMSSPVALPSAPAAGLVGAPAPDARAPEVKPSDSNK